MKLTQTKLKQLITEVINEVRVGPQIPSGISGERLAKIHTLIDSGEHEMARSLLDALGASPSYIDDYIEYSQVGDLEKLGNKNAAMWEPVTSNTPRDKETGFEIPQMKQGFTYDDSDAIDDEAKALVDDKVKKQFGMTPDEYLDDWDWGFVPSEVKDLNKLYQDRYRTNAALGSYPEDSEMYQLIKKSKNKR
jgi:hypothetical protein